MSQVGRKNRSAATLRYAQWGYKTSAILIDCGNAWKGWKTWCEIIALALVEYHCVIGLYQKRWLKVEFTFITTISFSRELLKLYLTF